MMISTDVLLLSLLLVVLFTIVSSKILVVSYILCSVGLIILLIVSTRQRESYSRMDVFPWNEANLVVKRNPNSTVIDCNWDFEPGSNDKYFCFSDPVVRPYSNTE